MIQAAATANTSRGSREIERGGQFWQASGQILG
jgi:hypothetical protein